MVSEYNVMGKNIEKISEYRVLCALIWMQMTCLRNVLGGAQLAYFSLTELSAFGVRCVYLLNLTALLKFLLS